MRDRTHVLMYAMEEGGIFKARFSSPEEYAEVLETGSIQVIDYSSDDFRDEPVHYVVLARVEEDFDFGLARSRREAAA